jgi:hypothetical protein
MLTQGQGAARLIQGKTAKSLANGFVTIQTSGLRELAEKLEDMAASVGKKANLDAIVRRGARIIERGYENRVGDVTGGLKKSTKIELRRYERATVAVVGPAQTGNVGSSATQASGNHAWLLEFGSGRRRPGTKGRRTYLNVHQMINGRMRRHSSANDEQFKNMSRGYYFLMGSINEPTRQARMGSGYPHDFGHTGGRHHPITLHPGDTYRPMPAKHPMERTIQAEQQAVFSTLRVALENAIAKGVS